jgi:hypothetical protein
LFGICLSAVFLAGNLKFGACSLEFPWNLVLVVWSLFVFWCLQFAILDTKFQGRAKYLWLGPEDQVFQD